MREPTEQEKHLMYDFNNSNQWEWHTTFVGTTMQSNYRLYYCVDRIMELFTPSSIIEIGTARGALATYLGLWGLKLNVPVVTLDIVDIREFPLGKIGVQFLQLNCFEEMTKEIVLSHINNKPTLLICDGGDKQKEFIEYVPLVPSGSVIMAHDYGVEFHLENVQSVMHLVEPVLRDRWNEMGNQAVWFRKK
jgi:23S rRNA U2552 (ribose-2'-O)-methylase RlmE/FtsJ